MESINSDSDERSLNRANEIVSFVSIERIFGTRQAFNVCICALLQCYSITSVCINLLNVSVICILSECKSISPTITLELVLTLFYHYLWCSIFFSYSTAFRTSYIFRCCHNTMLNIKRQDGLSCNYAKNKIDRWAPHVIVVRSGNDNRNKKKKPKK